MANENLGNARKAKNDEFYTQFHDIEKELTAYLEYDPDVFRDKTVLLPCDDPEWSNFTKFFAQNFETFGLKKLISTSYAPNSKPQDIDWEPSLFEQESPQFDVTKTSSKGKIFTLHRDASGDGKIDINDLEWNYLDGDGDFRSEEITTLRDEADVIITNPPFSLFREFLSWILNEKKEFLIIGNINCLTYKEVFPLIMKNEIWLGNGMGRWISGFVVPENYELYGTEARIEEGRRIVATNNALWLTNLDHGRRHSPLALMTMDDNIKFSRDKKIKSLGFQKYDNYEAIEVPSTASIPSDYEGAMGVPITFLDKYNPDQFEILGMCENLDLYKLKTKTYSSDECKKAYLAKFGKPGTYDMNASGVILKDGQLEKVYQRILIRHRKSTA